MRVNHGLSAYAGDPAGAGESLKKLLEFARRNVPKQLWGETEVRLIATAGLRLLDPGLQFRVMEECRRALRGSGFKFRDEWASVITVSDEGLYAWVVANYALGSLGGDPSKTAGIIELGGASAQNVAYEAVRESLLSGEYQSAGEFLEKRIVINPCTPKGYSHLAASLKFSLGSLTEKSGDLSNLHSKDRWSRLKRKHQSLSLNDEDLMRYCLSSAYIVALLHDSLGIALDDERIEYADQVGNIPLDWALGAFILHSSTNLGTHHTDWFATITSDESPTLVSLIGIAMLLMFIAWTMSKWRKPRLKTIYDLEKGQYIVTRIGRNS